MAYRKLLDEFGRERKDLVQRIEDGAYIPADQGNEDWQHVVSWLGAGNTLADPETIEAAE